MRWPPTWLGLVCSLAAQWLYTAALKTIPASRASIAATFEPVAAALFGLVLFGQKMDGFGVAGIVCEIAALVLCSCRPPQNGKDKQMAKKQTPTAQDYHKSETYKNADAETRRNLHRYKSELNITDEQMNWLMALEDVRLTPKEQRRKGNATAEMMVIGATVTFCWPPIWGSVRLC